jgi:hypothetical protein
VGFFVFFVNQADQIQNSSKSVIFEQMQDLAAPKLI